MRDNIPPQVLRSNVSSRRWVSIFLLFLAILLIGTLGFLYYGPKLDSSRANKDTTVTPRANFITRQMSPIQMYASLTKQRATIDDPLNGHDSDRWDLYSKDGGGCFFKNGSLHVVASQQDIAQGCYLHNSNFTNFAFQVQTTLTNGDLQINSESSGVAWHVHLIQQTSCTFTLLSTPVPTFPPTAVSHYVYGINNNSERAVYSDGMDPIIRMSLGRPNILTVIVLNDAVYVYVNGKYLKQYTDSIYHSGRVGVLVVNGGLDPREHKSLVAIKVLLQNLLDQEQGHFLFEAQTIAKLTHQNIIRVRDFGIENDIPYLVMDYAVDGSLEDRHKQDILPSVVIAPYVNQIASALYYAHEKKIVHRDVKPANMLIGSGNTILLSDFGLAVSTDRLSVQRSAGTIYYEAPEQIKGHPEPASDQYALAIVVYKWLSGDYPFVGTYEQIKHQHFFTSPPSLRQQISSITPAIEQVVFRALAKKPRQRFPDVYAFAQAFEQACFEELRTKEGDYKDKSPSLIPSRRLSYSAKYVFLGLLAALLLLALPFLVVNVQRNSLVIAQKTAVQNIQNTATSSKATTTVEDRATEVALQGIYVQGTHGKPGMNSSLTKQDNNNWDVYGDNKQECLFFKQSYHVKIVQEGHFISCIAHNIKYRYRAFQVELNIIQGDYGGIVFPTGSGNSNYYRFVVGTDGSYRFFLSSQNQDRTLLDYGSSAFIRTQPNQWNEITVVFHNNAYYFYVNQHYITKNESVLNSGQVGVIAEDLQNTTEVAFRNAKAWQ